MERLPSKTDLLYTKETELFTAPTNPCTALIRASRCKSMNLGIAIADKIPKITITTTSSIRVKPFLVLIIHSCMSKPFIWSPFLLL